MKPKELIQMNIKRNISKALLLSSLALSAIPAWAISYDSFWYVSKYRGGTSYQVMASYPHHFCYLSRVGVEETDVSSEYAQCNVYVSGGSWVLEAYLEGTGGDHYASCSAICYNL